MLKLKKLNFEIKSRSFVYTSTLVERQGSFFSEINFLLEAMLSNYNHNKNEIQIFFKKQAQNGVISVGGAQVHPGSGVQLLKLLHLKKPAWHKNDDCSCQFF